MTQSTFTIGTAKNRFAEPLFNPHLIGLYEWTPACITF